MSVPVGVGPAPTSACCRPTCLLCIGGHSAIAVLDRSGQGGHPSLIFTGDWSLPRPIEVCGRANVGLMRRPLGSSTSWSQQTSQFTQSVWFYCVRDEDGHTTKSPGLSLSAGVQRNARDVGCCIFPFSGSGRRACYGGPYIYIQTNSTVYDSATHTV